MIKKEFEKAINRTVTHAEFAVANELFENESDMDKYTEMEAFCRDYKALIENFPMARSLEKMIIRKSEALKQSEILKLTYGQKLIKLANLNLQDKEPGLYRQLNNLGIALMGGKGDILNKIAHNDQLSESDKWYIIDNLT